jgi:hypothetical protein
MNLRKILVPVGVVGLVVFGFAAYGWPGVAAVSGGLVMWALLHFTRLVNVMKKAAKRPIGYVGSAVMLNARLTEGVNLMHVVAMTQALGEPLSSDGADPEVYRWTDGTRSHVTCEFRGGKLAKWTLVRPEAEGSDGDATASRAAP